MASIIWKFYIIHSKNITSLGYMEDDSSKGWGHILKETLLGFALHKNHNPDLLTYFYLDISLTI